MWNVANNKQRCKQIVYKTKFRQSDKFCAQYLYLANKSIGIEIRWEMKEEIRFMWNVAKNKQRCKQIVYKVKVW